MPELDSRGVSAAITDTAGTRLGLAVQPLVTANPGKSGIFPLEIPQEAFAARVLLMRTADRSLDAQYYIWHGDTTGYLLMEEAWSAAERGVRVRLLLDDNGIAGLDRAIAALDNHPNIEVRLFNPFVNRSFKPLGYVTDFSRVNRRMHNKSLTADTQATIVGGRNVGDEYFGADPHMVFADLDALAVGPIAAEVAAAFDVYWNSGSAYPAESIIGKAAPEDVSALKEKFATVRASPEASDYANAVRTTRLVEQLQAGDLALDWAPARLVYDEPSKARGEAERADLLLPRLDQAMGKSQREIDIVSPYFVPGKQGTDALRALSERGVRVRILTNSLAANDVAAVHAGYAKRREPLLRSGVKIYELKPDPERGTGKGAPRRSDAGLLGSSSASLHAKTFSVDRNRVFVGSFNLDPRSTMLNTEMGLVIESPRLAEAISKRLDRKLKGSAYEVTLSDGSRLEWLEQTDQGLVRHDTEPNTAFFTRFGVDVMSMLPIEWML